MTRKILFLGGNSAIAKKIAIQLVKSEDEVCLAGRDKNEIERCCSDLQIRTGANVFSLFFDTNDLDSHSNFYDDLKNKWEMVDIVIAATGALGNQQEVQKSVNLMYNVIASNFIGIASILGLIISDMETKQQGQIVVLSSVAGDRGRQSNYIYGSAKAGINAFLSGVRNRVSKKNINVLTVKLGFVDTSMVFGKTGMFLVAQPEEVAKKIVNAMSKRRNIIYVPFFWKFIMLIIIAIPEKLFKRLSL